MSGDEFLDKSEMEKRSMHTVTSHTTENPIKKRFKPKTPQGKNEVFSSLNNPFRDSSENNPKIQSLHNFKIQSMK